MNKNDSYHFHRDCRHYELCKEEAITEGKHKYIRFMCPQLGKTQKYYPKDLHTIQWSCPYFEPKAGYEQQNNILDILEVKK
ncbi:MAG: hypothetical protein HFI34_06945 [Lachnospiraceae bacterium]|nr:hypothetical protein [Lachnospiraceae bacterium]